MDTRQVVNKLYGVQTYQSQVALNTSIGDTPAEIVSNDPGALQLTIVNLGNSDLYLWIDGNVSTSRGILIAANGGAYEIDITRQMLMPTYSWWGVCASGNTTTVAVLRQSILGSPQQQQ